MIGRLMRAMLRRWRASRERSTVTVNDQFADDDSFGWDVSLPDAIDTPEINEKLCSGPWGSVDHDPLTDLYVQITRRDNSSSA